MQLNHAPGTTKYQCLALTDRPCRWTLQIRAWGWPRCLPTSVVVSTQSIPSTCSYVCSKVLVITATTVPCKQLFSVAGHILNKKCASLSSSNLNRLLCLHSWLN